MSTTQQSDIHQYLLAAAAGIRADAGYTFTAGKVLDHYPTPTELAPLPVVAVVPEEATVRPLPCRLEEWTARFAVTGWVDVPFGADGLARAGLLLDDLRATFYLDRTCGDRSIDLQIHHVRSLPDRHRPLYRVQLRLTVRWHVAA